MSIVAYLVGYVIWSVAALLYPDHPRQRDSWYGFAQFKEQYQIAALLGAIATIATIVCIIAPPLIIPTAWLYTLSNLIWSVSEFHKEENPPPGNEHYSSVKQALYARYALSVALSSTLTAIAVTTAAIFPAAAFMIITTTTVIGAALTIASFYYAAKSMLSDCPPDIVQHSYGVLSEQLSFTLDQQPKPEVAMTYDVGVKIEKKHATRSFDTPEINRSIDFSSRSPTCHQN